MAQWAWLVALFPLLAFALMEVAPGRLRLRRDTLGTVAVAASFVVSLAVLVDVWAGARAAASWQWAQVGPVQIPMGWQVDPLSAVMLVVVNLVSLMVHVFSLSYMEGDVRYGRYYAILSLFTFSMLGLLLVDNFLGLFIFWELVGLCSFVLIGHWYEEKANSNAAMKAFLTTRVGDVAMLIGILVLFAHLGTLKYGDIWSAAQSGQLSLDVITTASLLLFGGAIGKSAQFPLHVWLPDAMAGPTPVSALIHAATMVAAGVYLVARAFPLFSLSPTALYWVAVTGGFTAIFAATIAVVQDDIKKVLAYSTISQLGYMFLGLGAGSLVAGSFHLVTQAFFKSLLFLAAGSVIHAVHTQNLHEMGGLYPRMKWTAWTWMIGALSMAGIPPLAGFWSKDEVLLAAYRSPYPILFWLALVAAFLTAFYITRATWLAFFGTARDEQRARHAHESGWRMQLPLGVLALLAAGAGLLGASWFGHPFTHFIAGSVPAGTHLAEPEPAGLVQGLALLAAVAGIAVAGGIYGGGWVSRASLIRAGRPLYVLLKRKYFVDELYGWVFVKGTVALSWLTGAFDRYIVDGIVNAVGWLGVQLAYATGDFDQAVIDGAVNGVGQAVEGGGRLLRRAQTGYVSTYLVTLATAVVAVLILLVLRR
ncbi:MAG: NADH-quinone oxidoreductase subunit L [Limnochordaceae bacterium]|nr:NADH-quinone oxidoreductase subunit L [Limnochordaceae bacterium]